MARELTDKRIPAAFLPEGLRYRGFLILPRLKTRLKYDDNIFSEKNNKTSDFIFEINPEFIISKAYRSHSTRLKVEAGARRFFDRTSENTERISITSESRLSATNHLSIPVNISAASTPLSRGKPGDAGFTQERVQKQAYSIGSGINYRFNRLSIKFLGKYSTASFDNGVSRQTGDVIEFSNNNRETLQANIFADYGILARSRQTPAHRLFMNLEVKDRHFENFDAFNRDDREYSALIGIKTDYKGLIVGTAGIGALTQTFERNGADNIRKLDFELDLNFIVSPKLTITTTAQRGINQDNQFRQGTLSSQYQLGADYELQHNLYAGAAFEYTQDQIDETDREDQVYKGIINLRYLHGRHFESVLEYKHTDRQSTDEDSGFKKNIIMYKLTSKL